MAISTGSAPLIPTFIRRRGSRPVYIATVVLIILVLAYQSYDLDHVRMLRTPELLDDINNSTFGVSLRLRFALVLGVLNS